jgi:hypothetical protein
MRKNVVNLVIFGILLFPVILWLLWLIKPSVKSNILILDKTALTKEGLEHRAFDWVLAHRKYFKPDGSFYSAEKDYIGFFPGENDQFVIKDLSGWSSGQIDSLSAKLDLAYFTETYGIYKNEWYQIKDRTDYSELLYGGLAKNDVLLMRKMMEKKKLILAEFNLFATPTTASVRNEAEKLFGLKWSGWTGRYYEQLDTTKNPDLPKWIIKLYKRQHQNQWPFTNPGIVFVHSSDTIAILEKGTSLTFGVPVVRSFKYGVEKYDLPKEISYPYWFDITLSTDTANKVISYYELFTNQKGDSILHHHNIPKIFPAAFEHLRDSPFYYFCGDFTDSPMHRTLAEIAGIQYIKMFVMNDSDLSDRTPFFWRYYLPMTSKILDDYFK